MVVKIFDSGLMTIPKQCFDGGRCANQKPPPEHGNKGTMFGS